MAPSRPRPPRRPRKAPINLSVRVDLVRQARALELDISELLEASLEAAIRERTREAWLAENQDAIDAYKARVEAGGVFSDDWRKL